MERSWSLAIRVALAILIPIGVVWFLIVAAPLIEALIIASLLATLLSPLVDLLSRRARLKRPLAGMLVFVLFLVVLAGIPAVAGTLAFGQFRRLGIEIQQATEALQSFLARPISLFGFTLYPEVGLDYLERISGNAIASIPGDSLNLLGGVTTNLLWGLVILVSLYYLLKEGYRIQPALISLLPVPLQADAKALLAEIAYLWGLFFRVQLLIFFILAVLFALGTFLVVILFRTGLLPFSFIALVLLLALVYTLVQQVDNLWLRPQLLGRRLDLHPGLVVIALVAALAFSGVLGALIIVPCLATVKAVWRFYRRRALGESVPAPQDEASPDIQPSGSGEIQARQGGKAEPTGGAKNS